MNKDQAEVINAALDERHRAISPLYADLMSKYSGLAMNDVVIGELRQDTENLEANKRILTNFVGLLPSVKDEGFTVSTAQEARLIQSSVFWLRYNDYKYSFSTPQNQAFYIIGCKKQKPIQDRCYDTSLLLASASSASDIRTVMTWSSELDAINSKMNSNLASSFSEDQIKKLFMTENKNLRLSIYEPDFVVASMSYMYSGFKDRYPRRRLSMTDDQRVAYSWQGWKSRHEGGPIISPPAHLDRLAITDELLVQYDVFDYLGDLATKFGKAEMLKSLINKYSTDPKDAMDALLEQPSDS